MTKMFSVRTLKTLILGAVVALAPVVASALTVTPGDIRVIEKGSASATQTGFIDDGVFGMEWTGVGSGSSVRYYQQFTVSEEFDITLADYGIDGLTVALLLPGLVSGGGSAQALAVEKIGAGDVGTTVFEGLAAGEYTLFLHQFSALSDGLAFFDLGAGGVAADVPLPFGFVLLASAMGGLVLVRRRGATA